MADLNWKYKIIPKVFNSNELDILKEYTKRKHFLNRTNFDMVQSNNYDTRFYKDDLMEVLLLNKKHIFEKAADLTLNETYTFWRCYTYNSELKKHKDRPSCEISATIFIDSDNHDWPIYMDGKPIYLSRGDGVLYRGCDIEHWREPYKGDFHTQVFFHYVDANGKYADYKGDIKR